MDKLEEFTTKGNTIVDEVFPAVILDTLKKAEDATKVPRSALVGGVVLVKLLMLFLLGGAQLLINVVGFLYPTFASFKAIDSLDKEDDTLWLTYWVVYACFNVVEQATDVFISWIPFYFFLKLGFLVWCVHPSTKGALIVYSAAIKPMFEKGIEHATAAAANVSAPAEEEVTKKEE